MRLREIVSGATVPTSIPQPHASPEAFSAGARAIATATTGLSEELARAAGIRVRAEHIKREHEARTEADRVESELRAQVTADLATLKNTEADPDEYRTQSLKLLQDYAETVPGLTKNSRAAELLQGRMPKFFGKHQLDVVHEADAKWTDREKGSSAQTVENYHQEIAALDYRDTAGIREAAGKMLAHIEGQRALFGAEATDKRLIAEKQTIAKTVAARHVQDNPDDFLAGGDRQYTGLLKDTALTELRTRAQARSEHLTRSRREAQERNEKAITEAWNKRAEETATDLSGAVANGEPGTLERVEHFGPRGLNYLRRADYEHLRTKAASPSDVDDPATRTHVIEAVAQMYPTMSRSQIAALRQQRLISDKTEVWALEHLRAREQFTQDQKNSTIVREQSEVERTGIELLTTTGPLEKLEGKSQKLRASFRLQMLERSAAFGGKESPRAVMYDLLPKLWTELQPDYRAQIETMEKQAQRLEYKSKADLDIAYRAGKIKKKAYDEQTQFWRGLESVINQYLQNNEFVKSMTQHRGQ